MSRPHFSLKTLLWLMAVVAAFCAGTLFGRHRETTEREALKQTVLMLGNDNERLQEELFKHGWQDPELELTTLDDNGAIVPVSQAPRSFLPKK